MYFVIEVPSAPANTDYSFNVIESPDGINSDSTVRKIWVSIAQKHGIQARAINFVTPVDLCLHNDSVRALGGPLVSLFNF